MSILDLAQSVGSEAGDYTPPPTVPGRVLYMDADSMVYDCARLDESFEENLQHLVPYIQQWRIRAGAEHIECHLTMGSKGNRESIATLQEYQANRSSRDRELTVRVSDLRKWMTAYSHPRLTVIGWGNQEADDGVTQAMYREKFSNEAVLFSRDKDLFMVPGLHLDKDKPWKIVSFPKGYGHVYFDNRKLRGRGTSWFWHQLLMGDRVDNIPGLPALMPQLQKPTKLEEVVTREIQTKISLRTGKPLTQKRWLARQAKLKEIQVAKKPKPIGEKTAYDYLNGVTTEREAFKRVMTAYNAYYGKAPFSYVNWKGEPVTSTSGHMLIEQARLLWMRREEGEDVTTYFEEVASS